MVYIYCLFILLIATGAVNGQVNCGDALNSGLERVSSGLKWISN